MQLQQRFIDNLGKLLPLQNEKILIAVSGGVDSMVLLHLFTNTDKQIGVAHCNFQLREQANQEEALVKSTCEKLNINSHSKKFETEKLANKEGISIQMAARKLRYQWFQELCDLEGYTKIATAHHVNDNLETTILHLVKGTGIRGLTGIPEKNKTIIRPVLHFTKNELVSFAKQNNIPFLEDASNAKNDYERNFIRNQVIPALIEINPALETTYQSTLTNLLLANHSHQLQVEKLKRKLIHDTTAGNVIYLNQLFKQSFAEQVFFELIRQYNFSSKQSEEIFNKLPQSKSGSAFNSSTHKLVKDRNRLIITNIHQAEDSVHTLTKQTKFIRLGNLVLHQAHVITENFIDSNNSIQVAADKLEYPLGIRKWLPGDYFYPFGLGKKQKLKKYFINEKFSVIDKSNTFLLVSGHKIVWIIGHRMDDRFRISEKTNKVVKFWIE